MSASFFIAFRYCWSKKSNNAIQWVSWISMIALSFGVAALIIVLSVFNGFESLVKTLYHSFNPDLQLSPLKGKVVQLSEAQLNAMRRVQGIEALSTIVEEKMLLRYHEQQYIASVMGVDSNFTKVHEIGHYMYKGQFNTESEPHGIILGAGIAQALQVDPEHAQEPITLYCASRSASVNELDPSSAFHQAYLRCYGAFAIQQEFDQHYAFLSQEVVRELAEQTDGYSAVDFKLKKGADEKLIRAALNQISQNTIQLKNRDEQNAEVFRIMKIEKLMVFLLLGFILLIASFNFIGSLSLMAIDKRRDSGVLLTLGASKEDIQQIFRWVGYIQSFSASIVGTLIGIGICLGQSYFHWIELQGDSFVIKAYPVEMRLWDFVFVFLLVNVITFLATLIPVRRIKLMELDLKANE